MSEGPAQTTWQPTSIGSGGRGEVHRDPWMLGQPDLDLVGLVGAVVVSECPRRGGDWRLGLVQQLAVSREKGSDSDGRVDRYRHGVGCPGGTRIRLAAAQHRKGGTRHRRGWHQVQRVLWAGSSTRDAVRRVSRSSPRSLTARWLGSAERDPIAPVLDADRRLNAALDGSLCAGAER